MTIINLICLIAMVVGSLFYMSVHRKGTFVVEDDLKLSKDQMRAVNRDSNRLFGSKIAALAVTVVASIQFFLTEEVEFTPDFQIYDRWTILQVILLLLTGGIMLFGAWGLNKPLVSEKMSIEDKNVD